MWSAQNLLYIAVIFALCCFGIFKFLGKGKAIPKGTKTIPGPPTLPLIGNLHQIPKHYPWRKFKEWSDIYGPIMQVQLGRQPIIVLSDDETAKELLERRGQNYSSRPQTYMASELLSRNLRPLLMSYGDRWRRVRKFVHQMTMPTKAIQYQTIQEAESTKLLYDMLQAPDDFATHYYRYASGLMMRLIYNKKVETGKEKYVQDIVKVNDTLEHTAQPGAYLVDSAPLLQYIPTALAPFKKSGIRSHDFEHNLFLRLMRETLENPGDFKHAPDCFVKQFVNSQGKRSLTEDEGAYACGTMFEAGSGTTSGGLEILTMALLVFPNVLKSAQEELDRVCGDSIPSFKHRDDLPYIQALVKETLRWRPIVTSGIAHMSVKDDQYGEYFIPENTTVIGNSWAIHMDPKMYPEPDRFNPDRFLDPAYPTGNQAQGVEYGAQRGHWAFGFGRRACPGQHIGERSMYLVTARLLWGFDFRKTRNINGEEIVPDTMDFTTGFNSKPKPFSARIVPRSQKHADIIKKAFESS